MKTLFKRIELRCRVAPSGAVASMDPPAGDSASASIGRSNVWLTHMNLQPINQNSNMIGLPKGISCRSQSIPRNNVFA